MNLEYLRYFLVLVREQHYGRAAEQLSISQPGLSHAISSLESELGVPLFEKSGRNITVSRYGKIFEQDAKRILDTAQQSLHNFHMIQKGGGLLRLSSADSMAVSIVPKYMYEFKQQMCGISGDFQLTTGLSQEIIEDLKEDNCDIGFCAKVKPESSLEFHPIQTQQMVVIVPDGHPLENKATVTLKETLPYPQIIFAKECGIRTDVSKLFESIGCQPHIAYEIAEDRVMVELAAYGFGIAVMPELPSIHRQGIKAVPLTEPSWENTFYIVRKKKDYYPPLEQKFWDFVIWTITDSAYFSS